LLVKIKDFYGRERNISLRKYLIDWNKPAKSKFQTEIQNFLCPYWRNHIVTSEQIIPGSRLRVDYLNWSKMIGIEADGKQHGTFSKHFHGNRAGYLASFHRDRDKEVWLEKVGFILVRIFPEDLEKLSRKWFVDNFGIDLI
jgi:very-short-patch-repair endonuclease